MYRDAEIERYLEDAAASKPAPGGGSVSALVGALASAMSEMTANFTTGKKKFADVQETIRDMLADLAQRREALLGLMDRDVEAYTAVSEAYGMPRKSDEQKEARRKAVDRALRAAMRVPLDVMRQCAGVARVAGKLVEIGNPNLITDVGVSAILAEAACAAARLNVEVNLKFLDAPDLRRETTEEMDEMSRLVGERRRQVTAQVSDYLAGGAT